MKKFLWMMYAVLRGIFQILYVILWISASIEFLKEGDYGGFFIWLAFGGFFFWVVFYLFLKSRRRRKRASRYSKSDSVDGDFFGSFWDSSGSTSSDSGGGDGGGGGGGD